MKEEKYEEFIENDIIGAILMFQEMSVPNRIKAVLYILDNISCMDGNVRTLLKDNVGKDILLAIRTANKDWSPSDFEGETSAEREELANQKLIKEASELYYKKYPAERPTELEVEEIKEEVEEKELKNFYRLLT